MPRYVCALIDRVSLDYLIVSSRASSGKTRDPGNLHFLQHRKPSAFDTSEMWIIFQIHPFRNGILADLLKFDREILVLADRIPIVDREIRRRGCFQFAF